MQTFLPHQDYQKSARSLDVRRLGKQRVECLQILKSLVTPEYGWKNHPATRMWRGYESEFVRYALTICAEWTARGYRDTCAEKISTLAQTHQDLLDRSKKVFDWLTPALCRSHQSNLVRKDCCFYGPQFPDVPNDLPYVWPVTKKTGS